MVCNFDTCLPVPTDPYGQAGLHFGSSLWVGVVPQFLEAASGFEPLYSGFADHRLTPWLRRLRRCWVADCPLVEIGGDTAPSSLKCRDTRAKL